MNLEDIAAESHHFEALGFKRMEESTTDSVRWVRYVLAVGLEHMGVACRLEVEYELNIYDDPEATYAENHPYYLNGIDLVLQEEEAEPASFCQGFEVHEEPAEATRHALCIETLEELALFCRLLGHARHLTPEAGNPKTSPFL